MSFIEFLIQLFKYLISKKIYVISTNEELEIARQTYELVHQ